ncbi:hypothetical protein [Secundilactobacillus kimchicus]|uniref:hypothetical protein n=1 Tax=Secundilactobacillus kimchicus TaxID=528209 RepID=UPI0024A95DBC|nr:hypothetical protein [Secundilactobacillus kimchicus]
MKVKVFDLFNDKNDVRRFVRPMIDDEDIEYLSDELGLDELGIEKVLRYVQLTVKGNAINDEIELEGVTNDD